jgi:hypothetical protein
MSRLTDSEPRIRSPRQRVGLVSWAIREGPYRIGIAWTVTKDIQNISCKNKESIQ